jgi:hypothetical protein
MPCSLLTYKLQASLIIYEFHTSVYSKILSTEVNLACISDFSCMTYGTNVLTWKTKKRERQIRFLNTVITSYLIIKKKPVHRFFYVLLTVHLSITLAIDQLDAQIFNIFITILYMYMFRAISCSSSRCQIVLIQHLVSSLSVSDCPVHRLREFSLNLCTRKSLTESDDTRCWINTIWSPEDEQDIAWNMYT